METIHSTCIQLILIDFLITDDDPNGGDDDENFSSSISTSTGLLGMLSLKFQNQSKGFCKWFNKRQDFIKSIEQNEKEYEYSQQIGFQYIDPVYLDLRLEFSHDWEIMERLIDYTPLLYLPIELCNRKFWKKLVSKRGSWLGLAPEELKLDREIVLEAVKSKDYEVFSRIRELTKDAEFMRECIKIDGNCLLFCSDEEVKKSLLLEAVEHGYGYEFVKRNENGKIVEYGRNICGDDMNNTREIILDSIKRNGDAFEYLSEELKQDKEIAIQAMKTSRRILGMLMMTKGNLKHDTDILQAAIQYNQYQVMKCYFESNHYLKDYDKDVQFIVSILSSGDRTAEYHHLPNCYKNDRDLHLKIIKIHSNFLERFPKHFCDDPTIVLEAVKNAAPKQLPFQSASSALRNDIDFVREIIQISPLSLIAASQKLKTNRDLVLQVISTNGKWLHLFPHFKNDKELSVIALKQLSQSARLSADEFDLLLTNCFKDNELQPSSNNIQELIVTTKITTEHLWKDYGTDHMAEIELIAARYHGHMLSSLKKERLSTLFQERLDFEYFGLYLPERFKTYE